MRAPLPDTPAGTVGVRLKSGHRAWLRRLAERDGSTEGKIALRELERAIAERARELLEADMRADLAVLDQSKADTTLPPDDLDTINQEAAP